MNEKFKSMSLQRVFRRPQKDIGFLLLTQKMGLTNLI